MARRKTRVYAELAEVEWNHSQRKKAKDKPNFNKNTHKCAGRQGICFAKPIPSLFKITKSFCNLNYDLASNLA